MPVKIGKQRLYTAKELCERLSISYPTILRMLQEDEVPGLKVDGKWYISQGSLKALILSQATKA